MRQIHNGYVLLVVLVFLQLFMLLGVQSLSHSTYLKKEMTLMQQVRRAHETAEKLLKYIDNQPSDFCLREIMPSYFLQKQARQWWQDHACHGISDDREYFYLREKLNIDQCASVMGKSAQYYRTTLYYPSSVTVTLQDTTVYANSIEPACNGIIKTLQKGRQTLRWLN